MYREAWDIREIIAEKYNKLKDEENRKETDGAYKVDIDKVLLMSVHDLKNSN